MYLLPEIVFKLTDSKKLWSFFAEVVTFDANEVVGSHFYDDTNNCDLEYSDIDDFCAFALDNSIESSLLLSSVDCGIKFNKVVVLIAHDSHSSVVSLSVEKDDFDPSIEECTILIRHLLDSISSGIIDKIIIGYDPAEDDDMQIVILQKEKDYDVYEEAKKLYTKLNSFC